MYATIPSISKTPYADEIWKNTVAGNDSIFRRIYPKTGVNAPVSCIADEPAVSKATYTDVSADSNITLDRVIEPDNTAVKPNGSEDQINAQIYFPHIGSVLDYFLKGIQTALRPKGYGGEQPKNGSWCKSVDPSGDCSWNDDAINKGINNAASKYNVPASLLRAIFEIEMADEINNPSIYQCTQENSAGAIGVAQVTRSTYEDITCKDEQMDDVAMCGEYDGKLSRCNFGDAFELMARTLLYKAGCWDSGGCKPTCGISESDKTTWYNASCNYYGSFSPDSLTTAYAEEIPASDKRTNGDMNYCDIVCWKMGQCPPYP